jgi:uncharacterized protein DUF6498
LGDDAPMASRHVTGFLRPLTALAVVAVPAAGWFVDDWTGGTTLAVYWFETVMGCVFIGIRIVVHRRRTPRRGHFRYQAPSANRRGPRNSTFLTGFVVTSAAFCTAHGVFLAGILFLLDHEGERQLAAVDWRSVAFGCSSMLVFLGIDLAMDLRGLRGWSFWQIEQTANLGLGRVVVVHLTLIFGLLALAVTGASAAFFGVFVTLKSLFAISTALPQWQPVTPPAWLSRVMNRVPNGRAGGRFEDAWAQEREDEEERRARNERPWVSASG